MTRRSAPRTRSRAAALLAVAALAACTGRAPSETAAPLIQPGAPGEPSRELRAQEAEDALRVPEHTPVDVAFMQGMIPHHAQALRMTRLVPDRSARDDLPMLAERMDRSQQDEIDRMRAWLEARDEDVPSLLAAHDAHEGELMPGMLTEEEFARLEAADGAAFDRLFLELMLRHHEGALSMVEQLYADGGGLEPEIDQFAGHVVADQQIEIDRMLRLLADLDG